MTPSTPLDPDKLLGVRTSSSRLALIHAARETDYVESTDIDGMAILDYTPLCQMNRTMQVADLRVPFSEYPPSRRCGRCVNVVLKGVEHTKTRKKDPPKRIAGTNLPRYDIDAFPPGTITVAADEPFDVKAFYDDVLQFAKRNNITEYQMTILAGVHGGAFRRIIRPSINVCAALAVVCDLSLDKYCRSFTGRNK